MTILQTLSDLSQIIIAVFGLVAVVFAFIEYRRARHEKKIDLAIGALKNWDDKISKLTLPAMSLVASNKDKPDVLTAIRFNQPIKLVDDHHRQKGYGYLLNEHQEIPAEVVSDLRMALIHYLNAWESLAVMYNEGRADRKIIEAQIDTDLRVKTVVADLQPYLDLYGTDSWLPLRRLAAGSGSRKAR